MQDLSNLFLGPELAEVEIPSWVPASDRLNQFLDWPVNVPKPRMNPFNIGKIMADEALIEFIIASNGPGVTDATGAERVRDLADRGVALYEERGWLDSPESFHETPPPLRDFTMRPKSMGALRYEHLRFASEFKSVKGMPGRERWMAFDNNDTVHARVLRHEGKPRPWLVCVHGYGMGDPIDLIAFRARALHQIQGLNLLLYVWPYHGPRSNGRNGEGLMEPGFFNMIHGVSQAIWDLRRILRWLREDQGAESIGTYGLSLGGFTVALLASLEADLRCVIAGIPAVDMVGAARERRRRSHGNALEMGLPEDVARKLLKVVSPLQISPKVPFESRFIFGGLLDRLATPDRVVKLWDHWEEPRMAWYEGSHMTVGFEPAVYGVINEALERLQEHP